MKKHWENVTLEKDAADEVRALKEKLTKKFGFVPSISQTVKFAIKIANEVTLNDVIKK